jgi:heavy metal translocating P-type ATPase
VKTTRTSEDSTPARIAQLAKDAQAKRPRIRTFLEIYGEVYSKAVIGVAACAFLAMIASGVPVIGTTGTRGALYRAMGLLTVASPCALVLVPMAYVSAIATLATKGIILKGGRVLDAARKCRIIAMDKTGTLTTGTLELQEVIPIECEQASTELDSNDILGIAKSLSLRSSHPVSDAVIAKANAMGLANVDMNVEDFLLVPGGGVTGKVKVQDVLVSAKFGSQEFVAQDLSDRDIKSIKTSIQSQNMKNTILSFLVLEWKTEEGLSARSISLFQCEDTLRDASYQAVHSLLSGTWFTGKNAIDADKCDVIMLTGDNEDSARKIASRVGIDHVYAGLSPDEKLKHIKTLGRENDLENLKRSKSPVLMIGDGLNDAAALSAARVGVAISSPASAAASMASDVVVMNYKSGVSSVPLLLRISRYTHHIVLQNVALAAGSILILALPTVLGFIPLWLAVMFHEGSTLLVALNSLRLLRFSM